MLHTTGRIHWQIRENINVRFMNSSKGKYFDQKCLFLPHPLYEKMLISYFRQQKWSKLWNMIKFGAKRRNFWISSLYIGWNYQKWRENREKYAKSAKKREDFRFSFFMFSFISSLFFGKLISSPPPGAIGQNIYPCKGIIETLLNKLTYQY